MRTLSPWSVVPLLVACACGGPEAASDAAIDADGRDARDASDEDAAPRSCASECPWACVDGTCDPVVRIAAGSFHTCALTRSDALYCWGRPLGVPMDADASLVPRRVPGITATTIAAGDYHTCVGDGRSGNARVLCWGDNTYGQLGDGTTTAHGIPTTGFGADLFTIVAGSESTWLRTITGAYASGANDEGQLGDGTTMARLSPTQTERGPVIAAGDHHACALEVGVIRCWGRASWGQLGDGASSHETCEDDLSGPIDCATHPVDSMFPIGEVFAGAGVTCVVDADHHAWCAGWNAAGQLGDGIDHGLCGLYDCSRVPVRVPALENVTQVASVAGTTCFLAGGHVYCAGVPFDDATHDPCPPTMGPPTRCVRTPTEVPGVTDAVAIAGHGAQFFAVLSDGGLVAWGRNAMGVLGDGTTTDRPTPVRVRVLD